MTESEYEKEATRLRPMLVGIGRKLLGDAEAAEDATQDVLLRLWQMADRLRVPVDALARIVMRNHCIQLLRKRTPTSPLTGDYAEQPSDSDNRIEQMEEAIERLPALQQTILHMRHIQGMELKEMAVLLEMNEPALRKALSRARMAVRDKMLKR